MLLLGANSVVQGRLTTGYAPEPAPTDRTAVADPTRRALPRDLDHATARVTSYSVDGRLLTVRYQMRYVDCLVQVVHPQIEETTAAVTVQLQRVAIQEQRLPTCPPGPVSQKVSIQLRSRLSGRTVLDRADGDRALPRVG